MHHIKHIVSSAGAVRKLSATQSFHLIWFSYPHRACSHHYQIDLPLSVVSIVIYVQIFFSFPRVKQWYRIRKRYFHKLRYGWILFQTGAFRAEPSINHKSIPKFLNKFIANNPSSDIIISYKITEILASGLIGNPSNSFHIRVAIYIFSEVFLQ